MGRFYEVPPKQQLCSGPDSSVVNPAKWIELPAEAGVQKSYRYERIQCGLYKKVVLPSSYLTLSLEGYSKFIESFPCKVVQQIPLSQFRYIWGFKSVLFEATQVEIEIILDRKFALDELLEELETKDFKVFLLMPGLKSLPLTDIAKCIPTRYYTKTQFYFPYQITAGSEAYTAKQIISLYKKLKRMKMEKMWRAPFGRDIYEPRLSPPTQLEPIYEPTFRRTCGEAPKYSIVIPSYNSGVLLIKTLEHFEQQKMSPEKFEIIVVDDGSEDSTYEGVSDWFSRSSIAFKYVYHPRMKKRKMGDDQFRAGLSRNLGVKHAKGEYLVFIDSDMLVPKDFLNELDDLHTKHDVVQWQREHMSAETKLQNLNYSTINTKEHCDIPESGYWHDFYKKASEKGWGNLDHFWKYACTYCISLRRETFIEAGWFRKVFCFYGFEDTDLAWRLYKMGKSFHFCSRPVYHQYHQDERSEYGDSALLRQKLLKQTAKIFFRNNLDVEIYEVFKNYLREGFFS